MVKDYYQILGVHKEASLPEIQKAYQKLSLKFHPDKNGQDPFFIRHYENITEAYDTLSDDHKRYRYDKTFNRQPTKDTSEDLDGPSPVISSFFASKKAGKKGDLLTISWEVFNAEDVHINLIGNVASNGTQTIRILEEANTEPFFRIELTASNSFSKKNSHKELKIINLAYSNIDKKLKPNQESLTKDKKKRKTKHKKEKSATVIYKHNNSGTAYLLVAVMFFIIIVMLYQIHTINPFF
ncbi:MAG: J domain-containing protein [Saprospiraceae bacterium]|nr:J domain-containing protein [Saprospiraceae bacterium]